MGRFPTQRSDAVRAAEPLPGPRTRTTSASFARLRELCSVWSMDLGRGDEKTFEGCLNHRQMQDVGWTYAHYGAAMAVSLSQADLYLQGFPLQGGGSFVLDGAEGLVSRKRGIVSGPGADMRIRYSSDFKHFDSSDQTGEADQDAERLDWPPGGSAAKNGGQPWTGSGKGCRAASSSGVRCAGTRPRR